eukprot:16820-Heterococcus_DN1.PRE.2
MPLQLYTCCPLCLTRHKVLQLLSVRQYVLASARIHMLRITVTASSVGCRSSGTPTKIALQLSARVIAAAATCWHERSITSAAVTAVALLSRIVRSSMI